MLIFFRLLGAVSAAEGAAVDEIQSPIGAAEGE